MELGLGYVQADWTFPSGNLASISAITLGSHTLLGVGYVLSPHFELNLNLLSLSYSISSLKSNGVTVNLPDNEYISGNTFGCLFGVKYTLPRTKINGNKSA